MNNILVINGPNLNMLGVREPSVYGSQTLKELCEYIKEYTDKKGLNCDFFQSNSEGAIIDKIQSVYNLYDGCILNAGAYTHYSYAIRDAISSVSKPFIEVHMSDINNREDFRKISVISDVCAASVIGHGKDSYIIAVDLISKCL